MNAAVFERKYRCACKIDFPEVDDDRKDEATLA